MKKLSFTGILVLSCMLAHSQTMIQSIRDLKPAERRHYISALARRVQQLNHPGTAKRTRGSNRLVAEVRRNKTSTLDSTIYTYLSNYGYDRTSELVSNSLIDLSTIWDVDNVNLFDKSYHWSLSGSVPTLADSTHHIFDANHVLVRLFEDQVSFGDKDSAMYTNDAGNRPLTEVWRMNNAGSGGVWQNNYKTVYTYVGGKLSSMHDSEWNASLNVWEANRKIDFSYSGIYFTGMTGYNYNGTGWDPIDRVMVTLNGSNKITENLTQLYNGTGWDNFGKSIFSYDGSNRLILVNDSAWTGSQWGHGIFDSRDSTFYTGAALLPAGEMTAFWDNAANAWAPYQQKQEYTYTSDGKINVYSYFTWDAVNSVWDSSDHINFYYELYSGTGVNNSKALDPHVSVFPNPVNTGMLNIQSEPTIREIRLYDVQGRLLMSQMGDVHAIDLQGYASGSYLLDVLTSEGSSRLKVMKE